MRINEHCAECLLRMQKQRANLLIDEKERESFMARIHQALEERPMDACSPYMVSVFTRIQQKFGLSPERYPKKRYNQMILDLEKEIEEIIETSEDPLRTSILMARVGNYIDFAALSEVNDQQLMELIEKAKDDKLDEQTYSEFRNECASSRHLLLLCDNCGEIVFDKLMIRQIHRAYPHLQIQVMVRGQEVLNDATMEDAVQSGIDQDADVVTNGTDIGGTVYEELSPEARECIDGADLIISKGQGNYESFLGHPKSVYYLFLCKCDLFTQRFRVAPLTGMFIHDVP